MKTSYFANVKKVYGENLVSIAGKTPDGFRGRIYSKLAPRYEWWMEWKNNHLSEEWYKEKYYSTVLDLLDPHKVVKDIGEDAILCCYEKRGEFCHRLFVAEWLRKAGYDIEEL